MDLVLIIAMICGVSGMLLELRAYQLETDRLERLERAKAEASVKPDGIDPEFSEL